LTCNPCSSPIPTGSALGAGATTCSGLFKPQLARSNGVDVDNFRGISAKVRQDPKTFFEYWEKFFDNRAEEMFRRATRLYDKLKQD
jgi:hypothetical protein